MTGPLSAIVLAAALQAPQAAPVQERLVEIVVHGNHTTPDTDIAAAAGLTIGAPLAPDAAAQAKKRLEATDRFEGVDVRKRYRSIERMDEVVLVIVVDERPHPMELPAPPPLRPFQKLRDGLMFMPVLNYKDGYGFSYGAQFAFADVLGKRGRLSVPLTWGGERRAAAELERKFRKGPLSRLEAGAGVVRRVNPAYDVPDRRGEVWTRAERAFPGTVRVGGGVRWSDVAFGGEDTPALDLDDRLLTSGVDVTVDTRTDPTFPRNAVYVRTAWEHLNFDTMPSRQRVTIDGRGFLGLWKSTVLAVRGMHGRADGPLPPYEEFMLGGSSSVRGFRTGSFVGDRIAAGSAELRIPFSSPMRLAKTGVAVFWDTGAVWDYGTRLGDDDWKRGYGAGVFAIATVLQLRLDVAHGSDGDTRAHFSLGLSF
jgi:outer membrane protein assembly factor BamA